MHYHPSTENPSTCIGDQLLQPGSKGMFAQHNRRRAVFESWPLVPQHRWSALASPRGEGATDLKADRKLAHDTLPSRVDARAPMAYVVQNATSASADVMDGDYLAQRTQMRAD